MKNNIVILLAEDDFGHAGLIIKNLKRSGIGNEIIHFKDGQDTLNYLSEQTQVPKDQGGAGYVLLLDIRMPRVDGIEVLTRMKKDERLRRIPVIMVTTTDDDATVNLCYELGCASYISKPVDYDAFIKMVQELGAYLKMMEVPE
ncbi:MAG: response regulator [Thermodesulfovibrionia bacterium]|nr:response regulator [Thermodesulfovibrionia bacterium]